MKITSAKQITAHIVETDSKDCPTHIRYGPNSWTVSMGESYEQVYECAELESAFQSLIPMKTKEEIAQEIKALKALKPVGNLADHTQDTINLLVEELECEIDLDSEEGEAMTEGRRQVVEATREWKRGETSYKPSEGWGSLVSQS